MKCGRAGAAWAQRFAATMRSKLTSYFSCSIRTPARATDRSSQPISLSSGFVFRGAVVQHVERLPPAAGVLLDDVRRPQPESLAMPRSSRSDWWSRTLLDDPLQDIPAIAANPIVINAHIRISRPPMHSRRAIGRPAP